MEWDPLDSAVDYEWNVVVLGEATVVGGWLRRKAGVTLEIKCFYGNLKENSIYFMKIPSNSPSNASDCLAFFG